MTAGRFASASSSMESITRWALSTSRYSGKLNSLACPVTATLVESLFFSVSWVKSRITGTRLAAAPAERMTFSISSAVKPSRGMSVMLAFSTALRSFKSVSPTFRGSLMSLFTTCSPPSISTRMKLPCPARIRSNRLTQALPCRDAAEMAGRSVAWDTSFATFSTILSTRCIFSSMALLMDLVSSMDRR